MALPNIDQFNVQVLRAIAFMYASHPDVVDIDYDTVSSADEQRTFPADDRWAASKRGTIKWLLVNGIVRGDLFDSDATDQLRFTALHNAQLTQRALRILQTTDPDLACTLGEAAVSMVHGPQQESIAARIVERLLGP